MRVGAIDVSVWRPVAWGWSGLRAAAAWFEPQAEPEGEYEQWRSHGFTRSTLLLLLIQLGLLVVMLPDDLLPLAPAGRALARMMIGAIATSQLVALYAYRFTRSRTIAVQLANLGIYGALVVGALDLGGTASPTLPLLVLVPLFAGLFSGARWGIAWMLICVGTIATLHQLANAGVPFVDIVDPAKRAMSRSVVLSLTYLATGAVVLLYELLHSRLRETVALERAEFAYLAAHDPLTGLSNRRSYEQELACAFGRASRVKRGLALLAVDLDDFKPVNDRLGHAAGDALLQMVGERLIGCLRSTDTVARVGGDEFAIVIENVGSDEDVSVVKDKVLTALHTPFELDGQSIQINASLGEARYPGDATSPDDLRQAADQAMYATKRSRKGEVA